VGCRAAAHAQPDHQWWDFELKENRQEKKRYRKGQGAGGKSERLDNAGTCGTSALPFAQVSDSCSGGFSC
jgi:hypothetical protein